MKKIIQLALIVCLISSSIKCVEGLYFGDPNVFKRMKQSDKMWLFNLEVSDPILKSFEQELKDGIEFNDKEAYSWIKDLHEYHRWGSESQEDYAEKMINEYREWQEQDTNDYRVLKNKGALVLLSENDLSDLSDYNQSKVTRMRRELEGNFQKKYELSPEQMNDLKAYTLSCLKKEQETKNEAING